MSAIFKTPTAVAERPAAYTPLAFGPDQGRPIPIEQVPHPRRGADSSIGWREYYVRYPDGSTGYHQRPLNVSEWAQRGGGDSVPADRPHQDHLYFVMDCLLWLIRLRLDLIALMDVVIVWHDGRVTTPDLIVILGASVDDWESGAFDFREHPGAVAVLVIEVASPNSTRRADLVTKTAGYMRRGVWQYLILDRDRRNRWCLLDYDLRDRRQLRVRAEVGGRYWLRHIGGSVAVVVGEFQVSDAEGARVERSREVRAYANRARAEIVALGLRVEAAERRGDEAIEARTNAEAAARIADDARIKAEANAEIEAVARAEAEAEIERLRAEIRRRDGGV